MLCSLPLLFLLCVVWVPEARAESEPEMETLEEALQRWRGMKWAKKHKAMRKQIIQFVHELAGVLETIEVEEPETNPGLIEPGNIALRKTATQSSTCCGGTPEKAVDGNNEPNWFADYSCTATNGGGEQNPWWKVDLGHYYRVTKVVIKNRSDCCPDRLTNFKVEVGNSDNTMSECAFYNHAATAGQEIHLECPENTAGQFVKISMNNQNILTLCEVEVYST